MGRKVKDCLDLKSVQKARRIFLGRAKRGHPSGRKLKVCGKRSYDKSVRTMKAGDGDQTSLQRMVLRSLSKSAKKKKARREAAEAKAKPPGKKKLFNPKANLLS